MNLTVELSMFLWRLVNLYEGKGENDQKEGVCFRISDDNGAGIC